MVAGRTASLIVIAALTVAATGGSPVGALETDANVVYETYSVPTVGGATLHVEVMRDSAMGQVPAILTYTPYNVLNMATASNNAQVADDVLGQRYVPRGYARVVADLIGTRNSSGCFDYGGPVEQQSGVDLVKWIAAQPWSSGKVGMIGVSYEGTTANMVAARGPEVPELAAVVPIAAISRWWGYSFSQGQRHYAGYGTPLLFDYGFARTPPDPRRPQFADALISHLQECDGINHQLRGYDDAPVYDAFWDQRDYLKDASKFRAAVLLVHGWQDWNVFQEHAVKLWEALPVDDPLTPETEGVPFKRMWLHQGGHEFGNGPGYQKLLDDFFDQTLKGIDRNVDAGPAVVTRGAASGLPIGWRNEPAWPVPGTGELTLHLSNAGGHTLDAHPLGGPPASYRDRGAMDEGDALADPTSEDGWLFYASPPLTRDVRLAGDGVAELAVSLDRNRGDLIPILVDLEASGLASMASRGMMDVRFHETYRYPSAVPVGSPFGAEPELMPQDYTFRAGHQIGLIIMSSDVLFAISDIPGLTVTVHHGDATIGASRLKLEVVDPPLDPATLFGQPAS